MQNMQKKISLVGPDDRGQGLTEQICTTTLAVFIPAVQFRGEHKRRGFGGSFGWFCFVVSFVKRWSCFRSDSVSVQLAGVAQCLLATE